MSLVFERFDSTNGVILYFQHKYLLFKNIKKTVLLQDTPKCIKINVFKNMVLKKVYLKKSKIII